MERDPSGSLDESLRLECLASVAEYLKLMRAGGSYKRMLSRLEIQFFSFISQLMFLFSMK